MKKSKLKKLEHQTLFLELIRMHRKFPNYRRKSIARTILKRISTEELLKKFRSVDPESILEIAFPSNWGANDAQIKAEIARSIALKVSEIFSEALLHKYFSINGIFIGELMEEKRINAFLKKYL